jgi:hypothetical protein
MRAVLALVVIVAACSRSETSRPPQPATPPPAANVTAPPPRALVNPPRPAELAHVTIKALGMYCEESCPMKVRYALADIPQIYELGFDLTKESIFVSYDAQLGPAKQVTKPMLVAIKSAGFDPWLAKETWPAEATAQVVPR